LRQSGGGEGEYLGLVALEECGDVAVLDIELPVESGKRLAELLRLGLAVVLTHRHLRLLSIRTLTLSVPDTTRPTTRHKRERAIETGECVGSGVAHQGLLLLSDGLALLSLLVERLREPHDLFLLGPDIVFEASDLQLPLFVARLREPRDLFLLGPDIVFEASDLQLLVLNLEVLLQQRSVEQLLLLHATSDDATAQGEKSRRKENKKKIKI
jgi:hypothetical protein